MQCRNFVLRLKNILWVFYFLRLLVLALSSLVPIFRFLNGLGPLKLNRTYESNIVNDSGFHFVVLLKNQSSEDVAGTDM